MTKIALVCSSGGHLFQLFSLRDFWGKYDHFWVSFDTQDAQYLLADETVVWAHYPTNRNIKNLMRNIVLAGRVLRRERPDMIVSTGAGVSVPFFLLGRLMGIPTVYVESITRSEQLSMSARLNYFFAKKLLVQWPELAEKYAKAEFQGQII